MPDIISYNLAKEIGLKKDAIGAVTTGADISTTVALTAVGNAINTVGKFKGKRIWNDTTKILVIANGPLAADLWYNAGTGALAHTPI